MKSILLVEDDEASQTLVEQILRPLKIKLHSVIDGNDAIHHIIMNPETSLILMDLKLPFLDGFEATRAIKKLNPDIPIIAQTSYAMSGDREKAIKAGCDDYITKPLIASKLCRLVQDHLPD
ncbi:MAG: response regulator [Bacteroidales bacterium]|nr:response regulator [Bacteroidales bacterium]